jgi:peptidoglycan/xylan/chitin deacetylase (PgdA/CDA1 family)
MAFFMIKVPKIVKCIFFNQVWNIPNTENSIYLTFDDGPTPEITERVLEILDKYQIKATFFCIGDNVRKYPEIVQKILSKQHSVGNHTYSHLKGWKTKTKTYISNTEACRMKLNSQFTIQNSQIFRPPYGKITPWQSFKLRKLGYKIIMWDVLSRDYDASISAEKCYENVIKNVSSGSIIVYHDSNKAKENILNSLEKTIETLKRKGFKFEKIA